MTEAERQALIEDISNAVITRLNQNSVDWSSNTITFGDRYDIQVNERQNIKIPAIDKRNGITYGNLDLNTLLTAYGLTQAMKSVSEAEEAGANAVSEIESIADSKKNELNAIVPNLDNYLTLSGGEMTGPIDMNGNNISDVSKVQSIVSDGASAETIFAPYYSYSTLGVSAGDYQSFFMAWLKKMATLYPNIKASIIGQATPAYRSFIVCYMQSTSLTADGYPKYASGMFFSYKENEAYHFLFDNGTFKMNKVVTGDVYNKSEVDSLIANAGGDVDLSGYLPLSGGTMTGSVTLEGATLNKPLIVKGGDSATAGKIIFGENGQITNESTATLVGRIGSSFYLGHSTYPIYLRGTNIRPYYNTASNTLALSSDIPTSLPASDVYAWAKASTKPTYTASEVGASKVSYLHNSTSIPSMSVGELKIVGYSSYGGGANFKLPSGGTYYIVGVEEYEDSTIEDWVGMGINGTYSGGNTISTTGYHPWILVYRIS